MSMVKYQVLWIDDEYERMEGFEMQAKQQGIKLRAFKSLNAGFNELEANSHLYDAILLDAKFFENEDDVAGSEGLSALWKAKERLAHLPKKLDFFVLTGQSKLFEDNTFNTFFPKYYRKGLTPDIQALFAAIKESADNQEATQIRHLYPKAFDACSAINNEAQKQLLKILKSVQRPTESFDDELYFTQIRIIIEYFFRAVNKLGLLHDKCLEGGNVNLAESSLFMSGEPTRHLGVKCTKAHFPHIISKNVWSIISITGSASHTEDEITKQGKASMSEYRKRIDSPYLLYSLTFQLIDVLIWFKSYSNEFSDKEANQALWQITTKPEGEEVWISGRITKVAENGYGTFLPSDRGKNLSILPSKMKDSKLKEGQQIQVTTKLDSSGNKLLIERIKV
jgi:hypothetical protein